MKKAMYHFLAILISLNSYSQTFRIYEGDTINRMDAANLKQGHWIYFGDMKTLPEYAPEAKIEEGEYEDNRKTGIWIKYFPNGSAENEITFANNRPNGPYKIFYDNGQLQEEGNWKNNRNVGTFKRYYRNGEMQQEFGFSQTGKRDGKQKYYHENGQIMIEGDWQGGKEAGEIKEFYANGDVKSVRYFNDGAIDEGKTKVFEPKSPVQQMPEEPVVEAKTAPKVSKEERPNLSYFDGNGQHTLYNKNRQISQKGVFKNGKLMDGKWYRYDENGILQSIEIYKNGRYVGEGVISEDDK